jgi:hypothetical protein
MPYIDADFLRANPYNLPVADYPDAEVEAAILVWQDALDRTTRQWFDERAAVVKLDGTDSDALHFGVPIITCNSLTINDQDEVLDTDFYEVYNNRTGYPDDRRNPRIKLKRGRNGSIFTGVVTSSRFYKGRRNQTIDGTWGYTEADGSTPELIKRGLALLVIEKLTDPAIAPPGGNPVAPVVPTGLLTEEETDDHRKRWDTAGGATRARKPGLLGLTNNPEVLRIIELYKSPIGVAVPADWSFTADVVY